MKRVRYVPDKQPPDLGKDHDELAERAYLKRQMEARRRAQELLDNRRLAEDLYNPKACG